jgi:hypothetical protein
MSTSIVHFPIQSLLEGISAERPPAATAVLRGRHSFTVCSLTDVRLIPRPVRVASVAGQVATRTL